MRDLTRTSQRDRYARMRQNIPKLSSYSSVQAKHITSLLFARRKKRKRYMHHAIESALEVILHNTRAALKETRLLYYNKTTNYF